VIQSSHGRSTSEEPQAAIRRREAALPIYRNLPVFVGEIADARSEEQRANVSPCEGADKVPMWCKKARREKKWLEEFPFEKRARILQEAADVMGLSAEERRAVLVINERLRDVLAELLEQLKQQPVQTAKAADDFAFMTRSVRYLFQSAQAGAISKEKHLLLSRLEGRGFEGASMEEAYAQDKEAVAGLMRAFREEGPDVHLLLHPDSRKYGAYLGMSEENLDKVHWDDANRPGFPAHQ
jgi:hypothetical protein